MPRKPDTRTDIERLNDRISQKQEAGRLSSKVGNAIRNWLTASTADILEHGLTANIRKKLEEQDLTTQEYAIANRVIKDELSTPPARNVRGRFKYTTPSSPEDKKEYKKGGVKRKPREFAHGGAYRGKAHAYAAGGRVTDTSKPKGRKK